MMSHCKERKARAKGLSSEATVKSVLNDHIKQDTFWLFGQVVDYCCMKVLQKAPTFMQQSATPVELTVLLACSNKLSSGVGGNSLYKAWYRCAAGIAPFFRPAIHQ